MGKMVADHGDIKRGLEIEHYAQEAVIHCPLERATAC
jgi:hypothetical protein